MMVLKLTPVWFVVIPLLFAFLSPLWARGKVLLPVLFAVHAGLFGLAVWFSPQVNVAPILETIVIAPPLGIHLHLDAASLLLVGLFNFAGAVVSLFLLLERDNGDRALHGRRVFVLLLLLIVGCNGMVLTGDIFNLYVFLEIAGVSAYTLAAAKRDAPGLEAGLKYLIVGSVAAIFFLFGIVLIYVDLGTLNIAAIGERFDTIPSTQQILIGLLMLVGLGIKTELFPFNFWVPGVYQGSDPVVASLFSSVVVKAFLFVTFHLLFVLLAEPDVARIWLMGLGAATMIVAETVALQQQDMRRMLAYSSLGQVGLITLALGAKTSTVMTGALFHMVNHSLVKLLLFLLAAVIIRRMASARLERLNGLSRTMPLAAGLFVLGSIAVLGLPPLSGFVSKFWILKGFAEVEVYWPIALILLAALLEAGYYFRWIKVFYGPGEVMTNGPSVRQWQYLPLVVLAGLIVLLGIVPWILQPYLVHGADAFLDRAAMLDSVLGVPR